MMLHLLMMLSAHAAPLPISLVMDPLLPGEPADIAVYGAEPGELVQVLRGNGGVGAGRCIAGLQGCLQILEGDAGLSVLLSATADADGTARWHVPAFPDVPEEDWYFQAIVRQGAARRSNVVRRRPTRTPVLLYDDPYEPDDTAEQVTPWTTGVDQHRRLCTWRPDVIPFVVQPGEAVSARVEDLHAHLRLFSDFFEDIMTASFQTPDTTEWQTLFAGQAEFNWTNTTSTPAVVTLSVSYNFYLTDPCMAYDVHVDVGTPSAPCIDDLPNDDTAATATVAEPNASYEGVACTDDEDWYAYDLDVGDEISILTSADHGEVALTLVDPTGQTLGSSNGYRPRESRYTITTPGIHHAIVRGVADDVLGGGIAYTIDVRRTDVTRCQPAPPQLSVGESVTWTPCGVTQAIIGLVDGRPGRPMSLLIEWPQSIGELVAEVKSFDGARQALGYTETPILLEFPHESVRPMTANLTWTSRSPDPVDITLTLEETPPCRPDIYEPNDQIVQLPYTSWSQGARTGRICPGDVDMFILEHGEGGLELSFSTTSVPTMSVSITDLSGSVVPGLRAGSSPQSLGEIMLTEPGPYVVVLTDNGFVPPSGLQYTVHANTTDRPCDDGHDDLPSTATPIVPGVTSDSWCGDDDWWTLDLAPGESLRVESTNSTLSVIDPTGHRTDSGRSVVFLDGPPGRYEIAAFPTVGTTPYIYTFETTVWRRSCMEDSYEPNDSRASAVPGGHGTTAHLCDNNRDWFSVYLGEGDFVTVTPTEEGDSIHAVWHLPQGGTWSNTRYTATQTGLYHVEIRQTEDDPSANGTDYIIEIDAAETCIPDVHEPNDSYLAGPLISGPVEATACATDLDWWTVDAPPNSVIELIWTRYPSVGTLDVRLYAGPGPEQPGRTWLATDTVSESYATPAGGTFGVRVEHPGRNIHLPYTLQAIVHDTVCINDALEPNDTMAQAVPMGTEVTGQVCQDEDWYQFHATAGDLLYVSGTSLDSDDRGRFTLLDRSGNPMGSRDLQRGSNAFAATAPTTGTYYLRMELISDSLPTLGGMRYTLNVANRGSCDDTAIEPNDDAASATPLLAGAPVSGCGGDTDWFVVQQLPDQGLWVELSWDDSQQPSVRFEQLESSTLTPEQAINGWPVAEPPYHMYLEPHDSGDRYLKVDINTHQHALAAYTLSAVEIPACIPDPAGPNDEPSAAADLGPGLHTGLTVCGSGQADWYRLPLLTGESLAVDASFDHAEGDVDLRLYNAQGVLLDASATLTDDEHIRWTAMRDGPVFVEVLLWKDTGPAQVGTTYALEIDVH